MAVAVAAAASVRRGAEGRAPAWGGRDEEEPRMWEMCGVA